jgi:hypothetical protein
MSHYLLGTVGAFDQDGNVIDYFEIELLDERWLEFPWLHGVRFKLQLPLPIQLQVDPEANEGKFADYRSSPIPLISDRFRKILASCAIGNLEFYATELTDRDEFDDAPSYFAMNVVGVAMTANESQTKSELAFGVHGADWIEHYVTDPSKYAGLDIFRVGEAISSIAVSERVRKACIAAGLETLKFTPIEQLAG